MKRVFLFVLAILTMGNLSAQLGGSIAKGVAKGTYEATKNIKVTTPDYLGKARELDGQIKSNVDAAFTNPVKILEPPTPRYVSVNPNQIKEHTLTPISLTVTQTQIDSIEKCWLLDRFLNYVKIESQAVEVEDPDSFPLTDGQKQIAQFIHEELKEICKGKKIEIKMSPDYYIYVKVPSNIKKKSPSVMFMAHMDIAPARDGKGVGINPQTHPNYDGKDITLGNGLVLSPNNPEGYHLKDLKGKTIITTDGTTLLGADCKTGCAILVTLIEQMVNDKKFKHGDVYFCFGQNEEIGKIQDRFDLNYFDKVPDILIDVDGEDYGEFSKSNFTAEMRSYYFKGNQVHPAHAKKYKFADANTAMAYFIGQIPPEMHPTNSEGLQGYIQCYMIDTQLPDANNPHDARIGIRIRYFDKADGELYHLELDKAYNKTKEAFPFVEITMESNNQFYDNIAYTMHPKSIEIIERAAEKTDGIQMVGTDLRAGTTSALMVAKGLPGGPNLYSGQQAVHSVYEWCCLEEMIDLVKLTKNIVTEVSKLER